MHRELRELGGNASAEGSGGTDGVVADGAANGRSFGEFVARTLGESAEPVLRYSQRLALLEEAERRRINRFQANLMIASVQHRLAIGSCNRVGTRPRRRWGGVMTFLIVQALILWGIWNVIRT
jgi:hypothetical protein